MNKKGFTLVELIIVITLVAMVSLLATPNVIQMVENGNKDKMVADANNFLDDVMYKYSLEKYKDFYPTDNNDCEEIRADNPIFAIDLDKDYAGNEYDKVKSRVMVCLEDNLYKYYIKLASKDKDGNYVNMISEKSDDYEYVAFDDLNRSKVRKYNNKEDETPSIPDDIPTDVPKDEPQEEIKIAYAVYSADDYSLTFYKTSDTITKGETYNGKIVTEVYTGFEANVYTNKNKAPWHDYASSITSVTFNDVISPISTAYWFEDFKNSNFKTIDLSKLDTTNVTDMKRMFYYCESLESIIFGNNWYTANVESMDGMFFHCHNLTSLNLSKFNTENVKFMSDMFSYCQNLTSLNLSTFSTQKVKVMFAMFRNCEKLTSITFGDNWNTSNVTNMYSMFARCSSLTKLDLSKFDTKNVTDMESMFFYCEKLTSIVFNDNWNTSNVTTMNMMFTFCFNLNSITFGKNWNTSNVKDMQSMFLGCTSLKEINLSKFDTKNVTDMSYMFASCNSLTNLDLSKFDTKNVTDMESMFSGCNSLTKLDLSKFDTQNVTDMGNIFSGCKKLTSIIFGANWNTSNVIRMNHMFSECENLTSLDLSKFNTENVTNMSYMFNKSGLTELDLSNFNTYNVQNMDSMFNRAINLTSITLGANWNTSNVTNMYYMFFDCKKIVLNCSKWDVNKVENHDSFDEFWTYADSYADIKGIIEPNWVN